MNIGKYPLVGGIVQQLNNIDHTANNLANMNTNSYKSKHATQETFTDVLGKRSKEEMPLNIGNNTAEASDYINRSLNLIPRQGSLYTNQEVGSIINTGNVYDFYISEPNVYFVVEDKTQGKKITRDGSFLNKDGYLSTKSGEYVLNTKGKRIPVAEEGWEKTLALYNRNVNELKTVGNNEYISGEPLKELYTNNNIVVQRGLEGSNVNAILEMSSLIENHRLLDQMQRSIHSFQEVDKISNDKIGNYKS